MTIRYRGILSLLLLLSGGALLLVKTNRVYSNLTPTEGAATGIVLERDHRYEQTFYANRLTLTCLAVWLQPTSKDVPDEPVTLTVLRRGQEVGQTTLSARFIDSQGPSRACFATPLTTTLKEPLQLQLGIAPALHQKLRLQQRVPDDTFDTRQVQFMIDGEIQPAVVAYQAFYYYRPPLLLQLGGLFILGSLSLLLFSWPLVIVGLAILSLMPTLVLHSWPWPVFLYGLICLSAMVWWLKHYPLSRIAILAGAVGVAFTTWFAVYYLLPGQTAGIPSLRDIFFDPHQVMPHGSYIGIIYGALSLIGLLWQGYRQHWFVLLGLGGLVLLWSGFPFFIIVTTVSLSYFAAWGTEGLYRYLGRDYLARLLVGMIIGLVLLDLWQTLAGTLEYNLLS